MSIIRPAFHGMILTYFFNLKKVTKSDTTLYNIVQTSNYLVEQSPKQTLFYKIVPKEKSIQQNIGTYYSIELSNKKTLFCRIEYKDDYSIKQSKIKHYSIELRPKKVLLNQIQSKEETISQNRVQTTHYSIEQSQRRRYYKRDNILYNRG